MTAEPQVNTPPLWSAWVTVGAVWAISVVGAVLVVAFAPAGESFVWFPIVLAAATILSFVLQLSLDSKEGLVDRLMSSVGGSLIVLTVASGLVALLGSVTL